MKRSTINAALRSVAGLLFVVGAAIFVASIRPVAADDPPASSGAGISLSGRLTAGEGVSVPDFNLAPGGILEWPGKVRLTYGGGESSGLPPQNGLVRAQPGGNLVLQPQGDYMRSAIDLLPARGKAPDLDAIGEFTIHRVHPTATTQEMISYSALAHKQNVYGVVVEAHGEGELKPLVFMTVKGGLRNPAEGFSAEAMRMTEQGTMVFGVQRHGGTLERPVDSITLEQPTPESPGAYDSDYLTWVGKGHDGDKVHAANWRANVQVAGPTAKSSFALQRNLDGGTYEKKLIVDDAGDIELPTPGAGVILRSPNGKRWRIAVNDAGELQVEPKSP